MKSFFLSHAVKLLGGLSAFLLAGCVTLGFLLAAEKIHSGKLQNRVTAEVAAHEQSVSNYRAAAEKARAADAANALRVERDQSKVSQEVSREFQDKLADLRHRYDALRLRQGKTPANSGSTGAAPVPGVPQPSGGSDEGAGENGLPPEDALIASEQALQLQALIEWVRGQLGVSR